jgi:hypothetical protein
MHEGGQARRRATAGWFERNSRRLSLRRALEIVLDAYGHLPSVRL